MDGFPLITLTVLVLLTCLAQRFADPWLKRIEDGGARLALRKGAVIFGAGLVSFVARLLLLPLAPVPIPWVHDEFSYLLAGDTFAHGRLTNPPHQLWVFLNTFHVLQHPTYASIFPPAQGMALALGQLLGNPWIGVLLSVAAMCAAVAWALQGWLPARWALLGTLIALLRVDLMSYWVDSYWGGAVAATGGALVIGALPRILRRRRLRDSVLMGVGAAILANSRPVEGLLFCLPVAVVLALRLFWRGSAGFRLKLASALLPAILVLACTVAFMGYYNWRVTGNALLFPHVAFNRLYGGDVMVFAWQRAKPAPALTLTYANPQFTEYFVTWGRSEFGRSWARRSLTTCHEDWSFFLGPALSIPLLTMPWLVFDRRVRFLVIQALWCGIWLLVVIFHGTHYAAPLTATVFAIMVQAIRHLRQWRWKSYRVGIFASRLIVVVLVARVFLPGSEIVNAPRRGWNLARAQIAAQLQATPQKHLVIVRYALNHNPLDEWVYNAAEIDAAKVVWAREIRGRDPKSLLDYYRDRKIWLVNADASPPQLEPYRSDATAQSSH